MPFDYSVGMSLIPIRIAVVCGQFLSSDQHCVPGDGAVQNLQEQSWS